MAAKKKSAKKSKAKKAKRTTTKRKATTSRKKPAKAKKKAVKKKSKAVAKTKDKKTTRSAGPVGSVKKMHTKSTLLVTLADRTGLSKKEVESVLSELGMVIEGHIKRGSVGKFTLPGMLKMTVKNVPARKARKGINPFTGEPTTFKAKPASRKVKVTALKSLKEMVL